MNLPVTVNQEELLDILLNIAPARPVFIWGAPGIGKSALVEEFSMEVGLECVSLLGSQLAPEDIIGIPQIRGGYRCPCSLGNVASDARRICWGCNCHSMSR